MSEFIGINLPDVNFYGIASRMDVIPNYRNIRPMSRLDYSYLSAPIRLFTFYEVAQGTTSSIDLSRLLTNQKKQQKNHRSTTVESALPTSL